MSDIQFVVSGDWALASDGIQWVLQRKRYARGETQWRAVSFVRSTRDVLARCMREAAVPDRDVVGLLSSLPVRFDTWAAQKLTTPAVNGS